MPKHLPSHLPAKQEILRLGKHLNELITFRNKQGEVVHQILRPVMLEFYPRDLVQVIVGATILAVPVSLTEEVWRLGETLPTSNILAIATVSTLFITIFVYYNYYRDHLSKHYLELIKRVTSTYAMSFLVSLTLLFLLDKLSLSTPLIGLKRAIIVALPASMSAAVADTIK